MVTRAVTAYIVTRLVHTVTNTCSNTTCSNHGNTTCSNQGNPPGLLSPSLTVAPLRVEITKIEGLELGYLPKRDDFERVSCCHVL